MKIRLVLLLVVIICFTSCSKAKIEPNIITSTPGLEVKQEPKSMLLKKQTSDNMLESKWETDESGKFSYLEYIPSGEGKPYFVKYSVDKTDSIDSTYNNNRFIYEQEIDKKKMYGYMDENFIKLTNPISTEPFIFQFGYARIKKDSESYIVNSNFEVIEEYYPGYIFQNDTLMIVNWEDHPETEPYVIKNVDLEKFLAPIKIYNATGSSMGSGEYKVGFVSVELVKSGNVTKEDCVIEPEFEEARLFHEGLAAVMKNGYWGFINGNGENVIECIYSDVSDFHSGISCVFAFEHGGQVWRIMNSDGNYINNFYYSYIGEFVNGFAWAKMIESSSQRIIGIDGIPINNTLFNDGSYNKSSFSEGLIRVRNSGYMYLNGNGELAFKGIFDEALSFHNGVTAVKYEDEPKWVYIDTNGEKIFDEKYEYAQSFDSGYALVNSKLYEQGHLIDKDGNKYLEVLNIYMMTKFNDDGYALAFAFQDNEGKVDVHFNDDLTMYLGDNAKYFIIKIINQQ